MRRERGVLQMKVIDGQTYPMEQLGGLRRAISDVGLWFGPERPSHVAMTLGLTSEPIRLVMRSRLLGYLG